MNIRDLRSLREQILKEKEEIANQLDAINILLAIEGLFEDEPHVGYGKGTFCELTDCSVFDYFRALIPHNNSLQASNHHSHAFNGYYEIEDCRFK